MLLFYKCKAGEKIFSPLMSPSCDFFGYSDLQHGNNVASC